MHLDATEHGDGIVFLHAVKEGPANRSYGLQVAQLAGVPREVIQPRAPISDRARNSARHAKAGHGTRRARAAARCARTRTRSLRTALAELDPDRLSPKAALETIYRLRELLT